MGEYIPVFFFRLNENTVVEEEAKDPVCSSDIDMPIKTPVQIVR